MSEDDLNVCGGCEGSGLLPNDCGAGYTEYLACMDCLITGRVLSEAEYKYRYNEGASPGELEF